MKLIDFISARSLLPRALCRDVDDVVGLLVTCLAEQGLVADPEDIVSQICEREQHATTAIGRGLAVPHTRTDQVDRLHMVVATLQEPLQMPAAEDGPVDVFVLILGPTRNPRQMLQVLARLARLVKHESFLRDLRLAETATAMYRTLSAAEQRL